ncbi:uncharacterized protein LOC120780714 [Bactrocera tryoni]|uniref:uncharacterized protein LOC120780714 n=1 Tax=Bactrocera tryoni TaxID=59916 RepID=UPI001A96F253|nr:uncharacterized protein LOC120780714 [Bactrocera tryoni]
MCDKIGISEIHDEKYEPELSRNFTKQQLDKSTSAKFIMEDMSPKLSHNFTKLLVRSRLEMEHEFSAGKRKKSVLWAKVVNKMSMVNADVPKSKDLMQRKFLNLFATYKRIKRRNEQTGREATSWEFLKSSTMCTVGGIPFNRQPKPSRLLNG